MPINKILILAAIALLFSLFIPGIIRGWFVFITRIDCVFWLQSSLPIRYLDFWLSVTTLWITVLIWLTTLPQSVQSSRYDLAMGAVFVGLLPAIASIRYLSDTSLKASSRLPRLNLVKVFLIPGLIILFVIEYLRREQGGLPTIWLTSSSILVFILSQIALKLSEWSLWVLKGLRILVSQTPNLAFNIRWIGFSDFSLHLIPVNRDRILGKLESVNLCTFIRYAVFFPAIVAGPIDRFFVFEPIEPAWPQAKKTQFLRVKEPIWGRTGKNCECQYNFYYPRWAYAGYLAGMEMLAQRQQVN